MIGDTASLFIWGDIEINSLYQKLRRAVSFIWCKTSLLNSESVSKGCISNKVALGYCNRESKVLRKICSNLGPQDSAQIFLNVAMRLDATMWCSFSFTVEKGLKDIGNSLSQVLK